jgi:hypothetical protein
VNPLQVHGVPEIPAHEDVNSADGCKRDVLRVDPFCRADNSCIDIVLGQLYGLCGEFNAVLTSKNLSITSVSRRSS